MRDDVWNSVAKSKGFETMETLLISKYCVEKISLRSLAEFIGCTQSTAVNLLDVHGIERRAAARLEISIPKKELKNLSYAELKEKYGIDRSKAFRMRKKAGVIASRS